MSEPEVKFFKLKDVRTGGFSKTAKIAYEEMLKRIPKRTGWTAEHLDYVTFVDGYKVYAKDPAWRVLHLIEYGTIYASANPFMRPTAAFMKELNSEAIKEYLTKRVVIE